jgi:hypothetical protein
MRASSTFKATKYIAWILIPYTFIGWTVFILNTFIDGKGGPLQTATVYTVKAGLPVGASIWVLALWRSLSRDDCTKSPTQWQCTLPEVAPTANTYKW